MVAPALEWSIVTVKTALNSNRMDVWTIMVSPLVRGDSGYTVVLQKTALKPVTNFMDIGAA